ncbi:MAG: 2-amino-4-hydroxy-6-hydroxymethyldihydropteridine diphosphokinase [Candidatus Omnitrophica bacterium]|nr:2-amino-4-hydroxy-6-hydroxymethyldihydropteridine diphosphokinase [Candidatus Omnitrophota bacterium]
MAEVFIGIGSNIGKREENINKTLELMSERINIDNVSRFYKNPPQEGVQGGYFINCVVKGETEDSPWEIALFLQKIEEKLGRKSGHNKGEARTIDLDILFYGDIRINKKGLQIPHPRLHCRDFVLKGLLDIAPLKKHPVIGKSIKQLWRNINVHNLKNPGSKKHNKTGRETG